MLCKVSKEDAAVLNALSDQVFNALGASVTSAGVIVSLTNTTPCIKTSALVHGLMNQLMTALVSHRKAHGELQDINSLADLRKNPEAFEALSNDLNAILACVLRGIDPKHDYILNVLKVEREEKKEKEAGS